MVFGQWNTRGRLMPVGYADAMKTLPRRPLGG